MKTTITVLGHEVEYSGAILDTEDEYRLHDLLVDEIEYTQKRSGNIDVVLENEKEESIGVTIEWTIVDYKAKMEEWKEIAEILYNSISISHLSIPRREDIDRIVKALEVYENIINQDNGKEDK